MNNLEIFDLIASHQNKYRKLYKSDNNDIIERYIENSTNIMKNALLQMQLKEIHKEISKESKKQAEIIKADMKEKIKEQIGESIYNALKL